MQHRLIVSPAEKRNVTIDRRSPVKSSEIHFSKWLRILCAEKIALHTRLPPPKERRILNHPMHESHLSLVAHLACPRKRSHSQRRRFRRSVYRNFARL